MEVLEVLGTAAESVDDGEEDDELTPAVLVSHPAYEGTEDHGGTEPSNEEDGYHVLVVPIII